MMLDEIDSAFEKVKADRRFIFSSRLRNTKDKDIKLFIIKQYEDVTGKILITRTTKKPL